MVPPVNYLLEALVRLNGPEDEGNLARIEAKFGARLSRGVGLARVATDKSP